MVILNRKKHIKNNILLHISFDDVENSFKEAAKEKSLFDNSFFIWLRKMHVKYESKFSLYIQNWKEVFSSINNQQFMELSRNAEWIKIGIHTTASGCTFENMGYEQAKEEWEMFVEELLRIGGSYNNIDRMPRLHTYAGSVESLSGMRNARKCFAVGFLSADDDRKAYYLGKENNNYFCDIGKFIYDNQNDILFVETDIRLDWFSKEFKSKYNYKKPNFSTVYKELESRYSNQNDNLDFLDTQKYVIVFTHEWQIYYRNHINWKKKWVEAVCKYGKERTRGFGYPMDWALSYVLEGRNDFKNKKKHIK